MDTPIQTEFRLHVFGNHFRQLDFCRMQILAGGLWQDVDLSFQDVIQAFVAITEIDRRIPHLEIQVRFSGRVIHVTPFAMRENIGMFDIMDSIAKRTVFRFVRQQLSVIRHLLPGMQLILGHFHSFKRDRISIIKERPCVKAAFW